MAGPRSALIEWLTGYASGLRFPVLFAVVGAVFLLDLLIPDFIPFADEVLLGLLTVLIGSFRAQRGPAGAEGTRTPEVIDLPEPREDRTDET